MECACGSRLSARRQPDCRDAAGNDFQAGDTVSIIKDLKWKESASVLKIGTKVKNIRLVESDHDNDCEIDGFGAMSLKSDFVKKV